MIARVVAMRPGRRAVAVALVIAVRIGLWLAPAALVRYAIRSPGSGSLSRADDGLLGLLAGSITAASRLLSASCLESALACRVGARLLGITAELKIGIDREAHTRLAHAWVESRAAVVIGSSGDTGAPLIDPKAPLLSRPDR